MRKASILFVVHRLACRIGLSLRSVARTLSSKYLDAEGDFSWSSVVENQGGTFTLTDKRGIETHFNSSGLIASREDRSGNTIEYTFTGV